MTDTLSPVEIDETAELTGMDPALVMALDKAWRITVDVHAGTGITAADLNTYANELATLMFGNLTE